MIEYIYIASMTTPELNQLFLCEIEEDDDFYDVIAYNIAREDQSFLLSNVEKYDDKRRRAIIFALGAINTQNKKSAIFIKSEVSSNNSKIAAEAINSLIAIHDLNHWDEIKSQLTATEPLLRSAALKYARSALGEKSFKFLIDALSDNDIKVRETAIDELAELGDRRAVEYITPLLKDSNKNVALAAETAIEQLKDD